MQSSEFATIEKDGYRRLVMVKQSEAQTSVHDLSLEIKCNQAVLKDVVVVVFHQIFLLQIADRLAQGLGAMSDEEVRVYIADHEKRLRSESIPKLLEGNTQRVTGEWQTDLTYDETKKIAQLEIRDAEGGKNKRSFFTPENVQKIIASVSSPAKTDKV